MADERMERANAGSIVFLGLDDFRLEEEEDFFFLFRFLLLLLLLPLALDAEESLRARLFSLSMTTGVISMAKLSSSVGGGASAELFPPPDPADVEDLLS